MTIKEATFEVIRPIVRRHAMNQLRIPIDFQPNEVVVLDANGFNATVLGRNYLAVPDNAIGVLTLANGTNRLFGPGMHEVVLDRAIYPLKYICRNVRPSTFYLTGSTVEGLEVSISFEVHWQVERADVILKKSHPMSEFRNMCEMIVLSMLSDYQYNEIIPVGNNRVVVPEKLSGLILPQLTKRLKQEGFEIKQVLIHKINGLSEYDEIVVNNHLASLALRSDIGLLGDRRILETSTAATQRLVIQEEQSIKIFEGRLAAEVARLTRDLKIQDARIHYMMQQPELQKAMINARKDIVVKLVESISPGRQGNGGLAMVNENVEHVMVAVRTLVEQFDEYDPSFILPNSTIDHKPIVENKHELIKLLAAQINDLVDRQNAVQDGGLRISENNNIEVFIQVPGFVFTIFCKEDYLRNGPVGLHLLKKERLESYFELEPKNVAGKTISDLFIDVIVPILLNEKEIEYQRIDK